ncbi:MAG: Zn-ribbon domain-containing OB-fold protein [Syntrophobacteraceae bacterium]|jgi:uncharacterized OB-fold protein
MAERPFNDISYNLFLNEDKLMGSKCKKCGTRSVPPRPLCTRCYSTDLEWVEVPGRGKLAAFTCIYIAPPFMVAQGYNRNNPYVSGVIDLEDGGRVDARIEGIEPESPEEIKVGTPMKVKFIHRKDTDSEETYLGFEPL